MGIRKYSVIVRLTAAFFKVFILVHCYSLNLQPSESESEWDTS